MLDPSLHHVDPSLHHVDPIVHHAEGHALLCWRFDAPLRAVSSAPVGGGIGEVAWVVNAGVADGYARTDIEAHLAELAASAGCSGPGVGMLTAARVEQWRGASDGGATVAATVGVSWPTWAADEDGAYTDHRTVKGPTVAGVTGPGTINIVAQVPVRLSDAALVNAVITVTEAKTQALLDGGVPGTGTATDAVCVLCPVSGSAEAFGGPRSTWGARLARATYAAVSAGLVAQ